MAVKAIKRDRHRWTRAKKQIRHEMEAVQLNEMAVKKQAVEKDSWDLLADLKQLLPEDLRGVHITPVYVDSVKNFIELTNPQNFMLRLHVKNVAIFDLYWDEEPATVIFLPFEEKDAIRALKEAISELNPRWL